MAWDWEKEDKYNKEEELDTAMVLDWVKDWAMEMDLVVVMDLV
jgi:hypothetical protein